MGCDISHNTRGAPAPGGLSILQIRTLHLGLIIASFNNFKNILIKLIFVYECDLLSNKNALFIMFCCGEQGVSAHVCMMGFALLFAKKTSTTHDHASENAHAYPCLMHAGARGRRGRGGSSHAFMWEFFSPTRPATLHARARIS